MKQGFVLILNRCGIRVNGPLKEPWGRNVPEQEDTNRIIMQEFKITLVDSCQNTMNGTVILHAPVLADGQPGFYSGYPIWSLKPTWSDPCAQSQD